MKKMLTIKYQYNNNMTFTWAWEKLGVVIEVIKDDFNECPQIEKAVIYDEEDNKILELKNEPIVLIGGKKWHKIITQIKTVFN